MATLEEVNLIIQRVEAFRTADLIRKLMEAETGIGSVLRILHQAERPVTSGMISRSLGVSTARIAVLLKKLEGKGLIIRTAGADDARTTLVGLTEQGLEYTEYMYADLCAEIGRLIDHLGLERLLEFVSIAEEIVSIMKGPSDSLPE